MSAAKSGSSLRTLVLTPERIPDFLIPSRSRSPFRLRNTTDRTRLLCDYGNEGPSESPLDPVASPGFRLRRLPPRFRSPRRAAAAQESSDTDVTTRAAMSLPHVEKVTTPYGFRAVLAASPCTRRRESLFHQAKRATTPDPADLHAQDPDQEQWIGSPPAPSPGSSRDRSRFPLGPVKALSLQVIKGLTPAALKTVSPGIRRSETR